MSEIFTKAWKKYMLELQVHPLRTKVITAGVLAGCQDIAAQRNSGIKKFRLKRLLLLMLYGFAYGGPCEHFFYTTRDSIFKGKKGIKTYAKKVLLEQLTYSPWNNFLFMMYFERVVEGRPWGSVMGKVQKEYPSIQLKAWKVRFIFYGFVGSCWAIFVHLKARSGAIKKG